MNGSQPGHPSSPPMVDNTPGSPVCPDWLLLLDDPAPSHVVVVGQADDPTVAWFREAGGTVQVHAGAPSATEALGDLVILTGQADAEGGGRSPLEHLDDVVDVCRPHGALVVRSRPSGRVRAHLAEHGFTLVRELPHAQGGRRVLRSKRTDGWLVAMRSGDAPDGADVGVPRWLRELGQGQPWAPGLDGWALHVPTAYPSQKAVIRLSGPAGGPLTAVVKVTRHPRFNERLDNEFAQLLAIERSESPLATRVPVPYAGGRIAGLALVVEEAVAGRPFLDASSLSSRCSLAGDAVRAIASMGRPGTVPGRHVEDRLRGLHERYLTAFDPEPEVAHFLAEQVDLISRSQLPDVLFHGDLGTWNLIVADGSVHILDWEAAERSGPPLWDLAYFIRSFAVRAGRRRGMRRDRALGRHLLGTSPLNRAAAGWIRDYADRVGLDRQLVGPLFHTCWMHRAVKEQARLPPGAPGHYGPLVSRLVLGRGTPGMQELVGR